MLSCCEFVAVSTHLFCDPIDPVAIVASCSVLDTAFLCVQCISFLQPLHHSDALTACLPGLQDHKPLR